MDIKQKGKLTFRKRIANWYESMFHVKSFSDEYLAQSFKDYPPVPKANIRNVAYVPKEEKNWYITDLLDKIPDLSMK